MFGSKKNRSKAPKFFCENCGEEVPIDEKKCPKCGRYFASVRCPACDYIGEEDEFKDGCPVCGYSSKSNNSGSSQVSAVYPKKKSLSGALPVWAYILTAAAFTAVLAALFFAVFK